MFLCICCVVEFVESVHVQPHYHCVGYSRDSITVTVTRHDAKMQHDKPKALIIKQKTRYYCLGSKNVIAHRSDEVERVEC